MKRAILCLMVALTVLSACGIRRPLIRPKDIPNYEAKRAARMKRLQDGNTTNNTADDADDTDAANTADTTVTNAITTTPAAPATPGEANPYGGGLTPATQVP